MSAPEAVPAGDRLAAWRAASRHWTWQGHRIAYRDEGEGPAVLLLHGYPTGSFDWHALWPRLAVGRRLVAPDFFGLGFSDKPVAHPYTITGHAESVDALLQHLGLGPVHVVAHDLGVRVAQEMLARRRERTGLPALASVALLNGAMCPEAYRPRPIQRLLATRLGPWLGPRIPARSFDRAISGLFGPETPPSEALLADFRALALTPEARRVTHAVGRFWLPRLAMRDRLVDALRRTAVPLCLVNGLADPNSGRHMLERWLALAPDTRCIRLERIGHWPQIEAPDETAEALLAFWRELPPSG